MASREQEEKSNIEAQGLEDLEFITLSGHRFSRVHLGDDGWEEEDGFLERRQRNQPVAADRRSQGDERGEA